MWLLATDVAKNDKSCSLFDMSTGISYTLVIDTEQQYTNGTLLEKKVRFVISSIHAPTTYSRTFTGKNAVTLLKQIIDHPEISSDQLKILRSHTQEADKLVSRVAE